MLCRGQRFSSSAPTQTRVETSTLISSIRRPNVQEHMRSAQFTNNHLQINTAQCNLLACWACFTCTILNLNQNTCTCPLSGILLHCPAFPCHTKNAFSVGISYSGHHHHDLKYFDGVDAREHYIDFYGKMPAIVTRPGICSVTQMA